MPRPVPTPLLHLTRIERLRGVIEHGLLPDNSVVERHIEGIEIGYRHIKDRRAKRVVTCGSGGTLADYVPFYFAPRSPMLYAITQGRLGIEAARTERIVYLVCTTQRLRAAGRVVVTSNRHAELDYAELTDRDGALDGDQFVDWTLMRARYWADTPDDPDRKERRQAECLVHAAVPWELIEEIATKTEDAARKVQRLLAMLGQTTPVVVRPDWYF